MTNNNFVTYIIDQLKPLGNIQTKPFFSSLLLSVDGIKLGLINGEKLYFHINEHTKLKYETAGMTHYQPRSNFSKRDEYQVPPDIIEDKDTLITWAKEALSLGEKSI